MADRYIAYKLRSMVQGGFVAQASEIEESADHKFLTQDQSDKLLQLYPGRKVEYKESGSSMLLPVDKDVLIIRYQEFASGTELIQTMPNMNNVVDGAIIIVDNSSTDQTHQLRLVPSNSEQKVGGSSSYIINSKGNTVMFVANKTDNNWEDTVKYAPAIESWYDKDGTQHHGYKRIKVSGDLSVDVDENDSNLLVLDSQHNLIIKGTTTSSADVGQVVDITFDGATVRDDGSGSVTVFLPGSSGSGPDFVSGGTEIDDVRKITLQNHVIAGDHTNMLMTATTNFIPTENPGNAAMGKQVKLEPPLNSYSDPAEQLGVVMEIDHAAYEGKHAEGFYATLSEPEEVIGKKDGVIHAGKVWFDDIIVGKNQFIELRRDDKAWGIQEDDTQDPNITGGTPTLIYVRCAFRGTAPEDGYVRIYLANMYSGDVMEDANGDPIAFQRAYKQHDDLGYVDLYAIVRATALNVGEFNLFVEDNFESDYLVLENRTHGGSCILIQYLDKEWNTSEALLQLENDLNIAINFDSYWLGDEVFTTAFYSRQDIPVEEAAAEEGMTGADGWGLYNATKMQAGVAPPHIVLQNSTDGSICYFNFHNIMSAEMTRLLRGKTLNISCTLTDKQNAFNVYPAKWTGNPDKYTDKIITGITNDQPVVESNWTLIDSERIFISEDAVSGDHTVTGTMTVPTDAENFAVLIVPVEQQSPMNLQLKELKGDVAQPFTGYVLQVPTNHNESHLIYDEEYAEFGLNAHGYASLRYTVDSTATPMPAGPKLKGAADITDEGFVVPGGAQDYLEFHKDGTAKISTTVRAHAGESIPTGQTADLVLQWKKKLPNDTWDPIAGAERTFTLKQGDDNFYTVTMPSFDVDVRDGDQIRLYAESEVDDGAYLQSTAANQYITQTTITFKEFVPGSEDEPIDCLYTRDELGQDWNLCTATDGHLRALKVGDLPENTVHHVIRDNLSLNDFELDPESGVISVKPYHDEPYFPMHIRNFGDFPEPISGGFIEISNRHVTMSGADMVIPNDTTIWFVNCTVKCMGSHMISEDPNMGRSIVFLDNSVADGMFITANQGAVPLKMTKSSKFTNGYVNGNGNYVVRVSGESAAQTKIALTGSELEVPATDHTTRLISVSSGLLQGQLRVDGCDFPNTARGIETGSPLYLVVENCRFVDNEGDKILGLANVDEEVIFVDNIYSGRAERLMGVGYTPPNHMNYRCQVERTIDTTKEYMSPDQKGGTHGIVYRKFWTGALSDGDTVLTAVGKLMDGWAEFTKLTDTYYVAGTCGKDGDIKLIQHVGGDVTIGVGGGITTVEGWIDYTKS